MSSRLLDINGRRLVLTDGESPAWPGALVSRGDVLAYYLDERAAATLAVAAS